MLKPTTWNPTCEPGIDPSVCVTRTHKVENQTQSTLLGHHSKVNIKTHIQAEFSSQINLNELKRTSIHLRKSIQTKLKKKNVSPKMRPARASLGGPSEASANLRLRPTGEQPSSAPWTPKGGLAGGSRSHFVTGLHPKEGEAVGSGVRPPLEAPRGGSQNTNDRVLVAS